ncbi:MAG: hypothetical protein ACP5HU_08930 [Phycisphaerae bacterium]
MTGDTQPRRKLRLINPRSPLSTITTPEIIRKMTFSRRGLFMPLNLAIHRGLTHYYRRKGCPLPRFSDYMEPDAERRIARSLGKSRDGEGVNSPDFDPAVEVHA